MGQPDPHTHYEITYRDPRSEQICTLRARSISDSSLGLSFVAVSDFVFEQGSTIINPAEEALRTRLAKVRSLHLSIYTILAVEEVGDRHEGLQFQHDRSNLVVLPRGGRSDE
jgi:hypothetical protein